MDKKYVVGVDMGGTNTVYGLVDRRGEIVCCRTIGTRDFATAEDFALALGHKIKNLIADAGAEGDVEGIGVGAPCANFMTGEIEAATDLPWPSPIPLAKMLCDASGLPVRLSNDANTAAIGEMSYGAARGLRDFIVVTLGTGVGSGIVCNGQLLNGHRGFGGELGHVRAHRNEGRPCGCGRPDCLETYCSAGGIVTTMRRLMERGERSVLQIKNQRDITARDIAEAAAAGDRAAQEAFRLTGEILGEACADFAAFSDPEAIILFGGVAKAGELLTEPMKEAFEKNALHLYRGRVSILTSELPEADAALLGASALGWEARQRGN